MSITLSVLKILVDYESSSRAEPNLTMYPMNKDMRYS